MEATTTTINKKQLIKRITEQLDGAYNYYEVEDIYEALQSVLINAFTSGESVKIEHICTISPNIKPPRMWRNVKKNAMTMVAKSGSLKITTAQYLKNLFKE
jgi:nucleoid DNA-binding protein